MRLAFSRLKNSIWRTGCCCLCTGTAILFHFERMIEVTLDSFLNWKWCLNRTLTSVGFKEAILAAVHFRNWIYLSAVQFWIKLHLLTALRIDLVVSLKFYLPSILCRGQGMQKGVISWLQVSNLLMHYFITDHRKTYWIHSVVVMFSFADQVFAHLMYEHVDVECCSFKNWQLL